MLCNFSLLFTCIAALFNLVWVGKHYVNLLRSFLVSFLPSTMSATPHIFGKVVGNFCGGELSPTVLVTGKGLAQRQPSTSSWERH